MSNPLPDWRPLLTALVKKLRNQPPEAKREFLTELSKITEEWKVTTDAY